MSIRPLYRHLPRLLVVLATLAGSLSTWRLWSFEGFSQGQIESGYFEDRGGSVVLTLYKSEPDTVFHKAGLDAAGRISMPPGAAIAAPFADSASYRVSADNGVPNIVIAKAVRDETGGGRVGWRCRPIRSTPGTG